MENVPGANRFAPPEAHVDDVVISTARAHSPVAVPVCSR